VRLFIRIVETQSTDPQQIVALEWLLLDRANALVSQGSGDLEMLARLVDPTAMQEPTDVVLLVPSEHCLSVRCAVPGRSVGQIRRALPYVVEEFVAGDIDAMHLAAGPIRRDKPVDVLSIERSVLTAWLDQLATRGFVPIYATPDAALLSVEAGDVALLFDNDRVLVRSTQQTAAIEADALKLVLESLASDASESGIRFVAVNGRIPELLRAEVAQATEHPIQWAETESDVTALAHLAAAFPGRPPAINLLQGSFVPPKKSNDAWMRWRTAAALVGVWALVLVTGETVRGAWASHRASVLDGEAQRLYRSYFPKEQRLQADLYKQMSDRLGGRSSQSTFLSLLGHLASGLAASPGAQVRSISFNDGRAELGAEVAVRGFDALEALKNAWTQEGVTVDISSAEQLDQQVHARIRLRGA
jgi:general secretion pathway protein L